jgi:hypothetical protein
MTVPNLHLAHEFDAAWIVALWKAIHGGDAAPHEVASQAIAALATLLVPRVARPGLAHAKSFEARLKAIGLRLTIAKGDPAEPDAMVIRRRLPAGNGIFHCFHFHDGEVICIEGGGDPTYLPETAGAAAPLAP